MSPSRGSESSEDEVVLRLLRTASDGQSLPAEGHFVDDEEMLACWEAGLLTTPQRARRVYRLLDRLGLGVAPPPVTRRAVLEHMATDKKHAEGRLNWVLPTESAAVVLSDVPPEAVRAGLAAALRVAHRGRPGGAGASSAGAEL